MALILTENAKQLASQTNIKINIIAEIEGFSYKFGTLPIDKELTFDTDGYNFDGGYFFDQSIEHPDSRAWMTVEGTTKSVTSQLNPDKGIEAVRSFTIELLDKDNELSEIFTPGHTVDDLLGQKTKIYLNLKGSDHPVDSILLMEGIVGQYQFTGRNTVKLTVDHANQLKRQDIFMPHATELDGPLASDETSTITVNDASEFILPTSEFLTYVKIGDEIIRYTGISGNTLTNITRQQLDTLSPDEHDDDSEVTSFYRLQGNAVDLALKIMLSSGGYGLSKTAENFNQLTSSLFVENAIAFESKDIEDEYGLIIGDHVQITDSTSNNITTTIKDFGKIDDKNSYIVVNSNLSTATDDSATVKFKSQYDTLPEGAGLLSTQLDVSGHRYWYNLFSGNFAEMDFYLEDEIKVDEFVNRQLYRPSNLYSIPGNRPSVKMTIPPLSDINTKTLSADNVVNPNNINVTRSVNRYSYNCIVYKYDIDRLDSSRYLTGKIVLDNDAITRIKAGKKVLRIESDGLRRGPITNQIIGLNARRFLDRYKFAAEFFSIETFMSNISVTVGDIVYIEGLNIYDSETGTRDFGPRAYEVINTNISLGNAKIRFDVLSTNFGSDSRFGVVSPSSKIDSGATTTHIPLKSSFGFNDQEYEKWSQHIGATVRIHSNDWTYNETTIITGFDPDEENTAIVQPLSTPPSVDYILDTCGYDDGTGDTQRLIKDMYCFVDPTLTITGVTNSKTFTVSSDDSSKLFAGGIIEVHNSDYSNVSEGKVDSIDGTTVTLKKDLTFTPSVNDKIELVGFASDEGKPYRII